jgi:hypothetical protein
MIKEWQRVFFAISILTMSMTGAIAQGNAPAATNLQGVTAAPTPADKTPASAAAGASRTTAPGAMGTTVVPGSNSAVTGDQAGTAETKTGGKGTNSSSSSGSGH